MSGSSDPMSVLLVEDDEGDVTLIREAFADTAIDNALAVVHDGVQALSYLRRENGYRDADRPDLILLDLNMPRKDGREVLAEVKADDDLKSIPVVVLTTSEADEDILRSYDLHANAYVTKPVDFDAFLRVVQQIDSFFVGTARLPGR